MTLVEFRVVRGNEVVNINLNIETIISVEPLDENYSTIKTINQTFFQVEKNYKDILFIINKHNVTSTNYMFYIYNLIIILILLFIIYEQQNI